MSYQGTWETEARRWFKQQPEGSVSPAFANNYHINIRSKIKMFFFMVKLGLIYNARYVLGLVRVLTSGGNRQWITTGLII